jgi:hypothetical protein
MSRASLFITATDLKQWADRREAQGDLPRLVRRLIHGTVTRVVSRSMPAGDSVQSGGWDGIVIVDEGNEFVPEGSSAWEFGAGKDPSGKAQKDYETRTADPRGIDPQMSTFIFVTPRIWQGKTDWAVERMKEGKWLEVRAYDADDLELWLELAPAVQFWFAQHISKLPEAATDLETFWRDWAEATKPALSPELVLAGRARIAATVHEWLRGSGQTLAVQAETPHEAIAAFSASILTLPEVERLTWLARTAVVESAGAWSRLAVSPKGLILIPLFEVGDLFARATRGGHRVFIPLGRADYAANETHALDPLEEKAAAKELEQLGLTPGRALELAMTARRSMMAFRRTIAIHPELQQPAWAKAAMARVLVPALLAQGWDESHPGDRQAVASIAGSSYEELKEHLLRWANESDPPIRRIDETWYLVSPEDAWNLLSRYLTRGELERFEAVAVELLGSPDPRFDLPPSDWAAARALKAKPLQSELLRRNIAEVVAMLATRGEGISVGTGVTAADFAVRIVSKVLAKAQDDWRVWASLSDIKALPPLAEAAPDVFLAAVERGVAGETPVLLRLFTDKDDAFFSRTQHIGLLDALEALAWSQHYFGRAARLVAALARIDPGGKHAKRPAATLLHFFWPEQPRTMAPPEARLAALDASVAREPEIGWKMLLDLFPHRFATVRFFGTHPPQWLNVHPERYRRPSKEEFEATLDALGVRVVAAMKADARRAVDVIAILDRLPSRTRDEVLAHLESLAAGSTLSSAERLAIWTALRDYIHPYKMRGEEVPQKFPLIEALYASFKPGVDADRALFLFDARPPLGEFDGSLEQKQRALRARQQEELAAIVASSGIDAVLALIPRAGRFDTLGAVAGELELDEDVALRVALDTLSSSDERTRHFGRGFASALIRTRGMDWAKAQLAAHSEWSPRLRAEVLTLFPEFRSAWALLEHEPDEVRRLYWQLMETWVLPANEIEAVAAGYLHASRPFALIDYLAEQVRGSGTADVARILPFLERAVKTAEPDDKPSTSFTDNLVELLTALARGASADEEPRVAFLEWEFLAAFSRNKRAPEALHREMSRNPEFFAKVVRAAHPRRIEGVRLTADEQLHIFSVRQLLASSSIRLDGDLTSWVARAREVLAADDLAEEGDIYIGMMFSTAAPDEDGTWPPGAIRDVIESVASDALEDGFGTAVINARGATWRGEHEGGVQERDLAAKYETFAAAMSAGWGRTAAMLRRLAKMYSSEARREDASAKLWRDLEI